MLIEQDSYRACGLVAMTTRLHRVDPRFESGRAHFLKVSFIKFCFKIMV